MKSQSTIIPFVSQARYLGIYIDSSRKFVVNFDNAKAKYYRSSNAILGKLGQQRNTAVALQLISSIAVPVLTYGVEELSLNKSQRLSLDHPWNRTFMKIYSTFDNRIVQQCQYYGGFLPTSFMIDLKTCGFLNKLRVSENSLLHFMYEIFGVKDLQRIAIRYNSRADSFVYECRNTIHEHFKMQIYALL